MKKLILAAAAAVVLAGPAAAVDRWLFGFSPTGTQVLSSDGGNVTTRNTGWFDNTGLHIGGNTNYFVGEISGQELRNFFIFDTRNFTTVTTASLQIGNASLNLNGAPSVTWTLYDFAGGIDTNIGYTGQVGIFNDLGTGVSYGSVTLAADVATVFVNLNAAGIAALNSAIDSGSAFAVGGRLTPIDFGGVVPEPATWAMLIAGFGLVGSALRRRRAGIAHA